MQMTEPLVNIIIQTIILILLGVLMYKLHQMRTTMRNIRMRFQMIGEDLRKVDDGLKNIQDRTKNL